MRFAGTTVIITGAAGGLGSAMAGAFAAEGGRVAIVDLPGSGGARLAEQINSAQAAGSAFFVACDLADLAGTSEVMRGIAAEDGVGVLVNNAAARIAGSTAWAHTKAASTLTRWTACQSA